MGVVWSAAVWTTLGRFEPIDVDRVVAMGEIAPA